MASNGVATAARFNASFPAAGSTPPRSISQKGFKITTQKLPILKAEPIEKMTAALGIAPPEMIFGDNYVAVEHAASGWSISFDAFDALDRVDKTGEKRLKVAYSKEWQKSREDTHDIKEVVKPFDWSYSTDFKGTLSPTSPPFRESSTPIPVELLKRPDPILFFDEVVLYEDELADNGIAMLSCKVRVMPSRMLLLCRYFMRLDNVMLRLRDTRIYIDFDTGEVVREYVAKEDDYEKIREILGGRREDAAAQLRDPNKVVDLLPIVDQSLESVTVES
jgi:type 2A phosphatase activator TIP41